MNGMQRMTEPSVDITQQSAPGMLRALGVNLWRLATPADFPWVEPTFKNLEYRRRPGRGVAPRADVYLPRRSGPLPSVVLVHGGAFVLGHKRMKPARFLAGLLVEAGFAVCSVDYRLISRGGRLPESLEDVSVALGWWTNQADMWNLNPSRISLVGVSAGATLSLLVAGGPQARGVDRVASFFGAYEFDGLRGPIGDLLPRLLLESTDRQEWRRCSPLHAPAPTCPVLLFHGTQDALVPVEQAQRLVDRRHAEGLPTQLSVYEGAPHGFLNMPSEARDDSARRLIEFLKEPVQ